MHSMNAELIESCQTTTYDEKKKKCYYPGCCQDGWSINRNSFPLFQPQRCRE